MKSRTSTIKQIAISARLRLKILKLAFKRRLVCGIVTSEDTTIVLNGVAGTPRDAITLLGLIQSAETAYEMLSELEKPAKQALEDFANGKPPRNNLNLSEMTEEELLENFDPLFFEEEPIEPPTEEEAEKPKKRKTTKRRTSKE